MKPITVSTKYQVVIPRAVRESLGLKPGQKMQVFQYGDRVELIPLKTARQTRDFIKGIDTGVKREADRL